MIDQQRHISDLLRVADREIKNGNLELAVGYIQKIYELDAKNVYGRAYKERIISLFEVQGFTRENASQKTAEIKAIDLPTSITDVGQPPKQELPASVRTIPEQKKSDPVIAPRPISAQTAQQRQPIQPARTVPAIPITGKQHIKRTAAAAEAYKTLLMEIWKDGTINADEQLRIDAMRETFAIATEEHVMFENNVRQTLYLNAIREEWQKGITNFEPQRKKFNITNQEQIAIEPAVLQLIQSLQSNGSVLVLDDEVPFLHIIKGVLEEGGYYCFTAVTGEEGLHVLETMSPDIIICDINFSKPHMSGFAFYEKFRSIDKFLTTPFIFLSGLDQDVLVRTGKKMGADDYLFKPIDPEMLLATVEGKLRRSRELKRAI